MSVELSAARRDATLIITLSSAGRGNLLDSDVCAAAIETLSTAERDDSVHAVILNGADGDFCNGDDVQQLLNHRSRDNTARIDGITNLRGWIDAIRDCPKPVIAAVEGKAAGAGFSLALACDLIVAGTSAEFSMPQSRYGLTPTGGGSWFVAQALPRQLAAEMLIEGKPFAAERLHVLGLVNRLVADGSALDVALAWAEALSALSRANTERIKSLLRDAACNTLSQQFESEKLVFLESLNHRDAIEGISALLDRRTPRYR